MKKSIMMATFAVFLAGPLFATPKVQIRLPERFRLLTNQQFDLRVEASDLGNPGATITLSLDGRSVSLPAPTVTNDNDSNPASLDKAWTYRNVSFSAAGVHTLEAKVSDGSIGSDTRRIGVQEFKLRGDKGNIILFLGDAMGTAYRDAGRIVAKSVDNAFREGFFDELQEMDSMPVSGMVTTYALNKIVPDSANAATAWATGSKTIDGALGVFPDNNDFKVDGTQTTKQFALDNPRVETLWEYLKRIYNYKTGIVTTSDVTDATPAGEGGHTVIRGLGFDIAKQYVDGVFTSGSAFDVIMGGGKERFVSRTLANSGDTRNLVTDLQSQGFAYVETRTQLNGLLNGSAAPNKLLGLFRTGNMNVAYDKLGLIRPSDEPLPNFGGFSDQPFLDEMTAKALQVLNKGGGPFILLVEGASIDKESHPNNAAGTIWDTIEFDKAIGVGREFARMDNDSRRSWNSNGKGKGKGPKARDDNDTLVLVTADHDQSMVIIGLGDAFNPSTKLNVRSNTAYPAPGGNPEALGFPDYKDVNGDGYPENTNQFRIEVGFRTGNHTGSSVPITAEGSGALLFTGYFDQTDIFFKMARVLSMDAKSLDEALRNKDRSDALGPNY